MAETITPGTIAVTPGSGVLLDSVSLTVNSNAVESETVVIRDPGNASQYAEVTAKGTQADYGLGIQQLKDSGRTQVTLYVDAIAGVTTEALVTLNITKGLVAQSTATSYTVTSGKTLRIQSIFFQGNDSTTTANVFKMRVRAASTVSATSPIIASMVVNSLTAVADSGQAANLSIPDGLEVAAGTEIGVSQIVSSTSSAISFCIVGYEY